MPNGYTRILGRTLLRLSGADRLRYLNGQISNDLRKLHPGDSLYACIMTLKGKMFCDAFVYATEDSYWIDAPDAVRETLQPRLERYIISDDVVVEDFSDTFELLHVFGTPVELPPYVRVHGRSRRYGPEGYDLWIPANTESFEGNAAPLLTPDALERIRIEHGIPAWGTELDENVLPAEAGLDQTAVDFHKGCYLGQEVVSRVKSVGHVNRALTGFRCAFPGTAFRPGAVLRDSANPGQVAGQLTSVVESFALSGWIGLGYLKRGVTARTLLATWEGEPDCEVTVADLPFFK